MSKNPLAVNLRGRCRHSLGEFEGGREVCGIHIDLHKSSRIFHIFFASVGHMGVDQWISIVMTVNVKEEDLHVNTRKDSGGKRTSV